MTAIVTVLKNGYSFFEESGNMKANCTCTLVEDGQTILIVDTLTSWDGEFLREELRKRDIKASSVTHAVATHGHSDHIGNLNMFTNAKHIVGQCISFKDNYKQYDFKEDTPYVISENISIIPTPGHTLSDISVIVKTENLGLVAIVGDLFERVEDIDDVNLWMEIAGSENPELQFRHRMKVLDLANYIIPGHGPMFKVTENLMEKHEANVKDYMEVK